MHPVRARWFVVTALASCGRLDFDPRSDLVAYYPMEVAGSTLVDATANHLDGVCAVATCATETTGVIGSALAFTGQGPYVVPDSSLLHIPNAFTIAVWADLTMPGTLVSKVQVAGIGASFEVASYSGGMLFCTDHDPGALGEDCIMTTPPLPPAWTHLAMAWDGVTKTAYIDAVVVGTETPATPVFDTSPLFIGADREDGTINGQVIGGLDEVRIYDRALSAAEIAALRDLR